MVSGDNATTVREIGSHRYGSVLRLGRAAARWGSDADDNSDWATNCPEYKVTAVQVSPSNGPNDYQRRYAEAAEASRRIEKSVQAIRLHATGDRQSSVKVVPRFPSPLTVLISREIWAGHTDVCALRGADQQVLFRCTRCESLRSRASSALCSSSSCARSLGVSVSSR